MKSSSKDIIIELKEITKSYVSGTNVIEGLQLSIVKGELLTLLGPSGCGKTTILRMIGGFELPSNGQILLEGKDISQVPPNLRPINTVFQKYALFPFLNIYDNIAFGLKNKKLPKDKIQSEVRRVLKMVDLEGFEKRRIQTLSGGQQQRVAIARALVNEPEILLLDEPLSALDYKMRQEMQLELKNMHERLGLTFIFVTHDQEEAMTLSDRIAVISNGQIQQLGTPEEIYQHPHNLFVADFIGVSNIYNGLACGKGEVSFLGRKFSCEEQFPAGSDIHAVIRPENVTLTKLEDGMLTGKVVDCIYKGDCYEITLQSDKSEIIAHHNRSIEREKEVGICFDEQTIHLIKEDKSTNQFTGIVTMDGRFFTEEGAAVPMQFDESCYGKEIVLSFSPKDAVMSDDASAGFVAGHIMSAIYVGDHYVYTVRSENDVDYVVDDEWLWNIGDFVSVIISGEKLAFSVNQEV